MHPAPADWPNTVTLPGSPPNAAMLFCTQPQRRDLVENAAVVRYPSDMGEPLCTDAIVHADYHCTGRSESCAVVVRVSGSALQVPAAVDPHHQGQPSGTEVSDQTLRVRQSAEPS